MSVLHENLSFRSGALSLLANHWRVSSYVQRPERSMPLTTIFGARAGDFSTTAGLTIRGGGIPYSNLALMPTDRMGPPPGATPPMRMIASWSGSTILPHTSLWHEDVPSMASSPRTFNKPTDSHRPDPELCKKPVSRSIVAPRAQVSRRCETQAPLGGKPPSFATVSVP